MSARREKRERVEEPAAGLREMREIRKDLDAIRFELERLNGHKMVAVYNHYGRFLLFSLLKGLATGLGTVLGATLVVSILVYLLSRIEFVPIIGDLVASILADLKAQGIGLPQP